MKSPSNKLGKSQTRTYDRAESVVFLKTGEGFGGLSNMAGGYPLRVNGIRILTSEALYQTCRFPHLPDVQRLIIDQRSPMTAKMKSKPYRNNSRPDWDRVRVKIMRWCLRVKLAQNWAAFSDLLLKTGNRPIVEHSRKDDFWGAKETKDGTLVGRNVLGRLLMELREAVKAGDTTLLLRVEPLAIPDFLLDGRPIQLVSAGSHDQPELAPQLTKDKDRSVAASKGATQASLFDQSGVKEAHASYLTGGEARETKGADLKPYPSMRDSGVPWLGEVPEHWEVKRLRNAAGMRVSNVDKHTRDDEKPVRLCNYVDVYKNDRIRPGMAFMRATATADEIERFRLLRGDVLITKDSEAWNDIGVPAFVENAADDIISGYHLALLRPFRACVQGGFLFRALQSRSVAYQFHVEANGVTRYGLSHSAIKSVWLPLPPFPEQAAIVRFLDYADRRIRRYIRVKQKLLKLLEEQKQAIIHRAVTRGLDPNVRLKPSGVEWLGDVPEHWEVLRVKQACQILRGKFTHRPRNDPSLYDGRYPFIQTGEVARAGKSITDYRQTLNERGLAVSKMFPAGTLVMTIAANIGDVAVLDFEACFPDSVVGFVPRSGVERDYLYYVFRVMKPELLREAPVNTQGNLNVDRIGSRGIALPPTPEQQGILQHIEESTLGLNAAIGRPQREIDLLREYRTRLIADVVTGKLDVREVAVRLPEEAEELGPVEGGEVPEGGEDGEDADLDVAKEEAEA